MFIDPSTIIAALWLGILTAISPCPLATNVAALAQISFLVFLLGPPLLGFVAQHWGIRWSFGIGLPLIVVSLALAGSLGRRDPRHVEERKAP